MVPALVNIVSLGPGLLLYLTGILIEPVSMNKKNNE